MLRLKLLGVPSLERDGELLGGRAAQRHRIALLALLALAPGRRLGRDTLIATLWPESDAERGRNLLKVATYVLRSSLGADALVSAGDELRLDPELVAVDVAEFEAALEAGEYARATALHERPFLDGFFLPEAPEFAHWVDGERARLAAGHRRALEALAAGAEAAGDHGAAVDWWRRRAVADPYDSRVALRLMAALDAAGNRAGALQHAAVHQQLLQAEFGVASAPEVEAEAERLRRAPAATPAPARPTPPVVGPAAAPAVEPVGEPPAEPPAIPASPRHEPDAPATPTAVAAAMASTMTVGPAAATTAGAPPQPRRRRGRLAALALLLVVAALGAFLYFRPRPAEPEGSIVVLPFVNLSADPAQEYFSDGLTEEVIARLAAVPGLTVISRTSAMRYKGTTTPLPAIADELGVHHVLEGSVRRQDGRVRITAQLVDARTDEHLWAESYEHELGDEFRVQERIAHEVARALALTIGDRTRRLLARRGTADSAALEHYRRARFEWNTRTREGHEQAIAHLDAAIERDSGYADAYAALADVYLTGFQIGLLDISEEEAYSRITWAAERALALDDESADAHTAFAVALWWQRNWPGAERELHRALDLNPGHATARSWYSLLLRGMGRGEEAIRESARAAELDPFGLVVAYNHAWQHYLERDYGRAVAQFRRTLDIGPYPSAWRGLGFALAQQGQPDSAVAAVRQAIALAPHRTDFLADLALVEALAGRPAEARAALARAKAGPMEPFNVARAHAALGEADSAFAWLERSNWRWPHRATRDDPVLDPLRADPRFGRLSARIEREVGLR